jgi:hypothetical protein
MKQISYGKQRETKNSTPEIEVVANAILEPPMHPGKKLECLGHMTKHDNDQTTCTDQLQERPR